MIRRHRVIEIALEDGTTAIMQTFADVIVEAEVRRAALPAPVVSWREIDDAEAKRIRDARPKPQRPAVSASADASPETQDAIRTLAQANLELDAKLAALDAKLDLVSRTAIARADIEEKP